MKNQQISRLDIFNVACRIKFAYELSEDVYKYVEDNFLHESELDPTGNFELWIENLLYTYIFEYK
jgi:hypothetical protein